MNFFKRSCKHDYNPWQVIRRGLANDGSMKILQERTCKLCGFTEVNAQWVG